MDSFFHEGNVDVLADFVFGQSGDLAAFKLRLDAERLSLSKGFDRLKSLEDLDLSLYPHQRTAVLRVLQIMRGRAILADEVGLGKTIEAGVIVREYLLRSLARKILILVPASLVTQWRRELASLLNLECHVARSPQDWTGRSLIIASIDTAKRSANAEVIHGIKWDVVVVDEAHRLKNRATLNWQFVNKISKKYILLVTATPIQNDLKELYNMITLLKPGQLSTYDQFKKEFMADKRSPKNVWRLRDLLYEVVVRSTRSETLIPFPRRKVDALQVAMNEGERAFYDLLTQVLRTAYHHSAQPEDRRLLTLILLLREACSSPQAVHKTLTAMAHTRGRATLDRDTVKGLLTAGEGVLSSKMEALERFLATRTGKVLVFTEFKETLHALVFRLERRGIATARFHGGLDARAKEAAIEEFRSHAQALVSTEAGGEGRNLQFCSTVVNYDLPWNPMRIEQRIGRVHRLGQENDVEVINMATLGTVEEYVLYLLEKKIRMFETVIGDLDVILARLQVPFEQRVAEVVLGADSPGTVQRGIEAMGDVLAAARRDYDATVALNDAVFESDSREDAGVPGDSA